MSYIHHSNVANYTIVIVSLMFSFVAIEPHPNLFVCFKGTCSKSPPAAISAGYVYH